LNNSDSWIIKMSSIHSQGRDDRRFNNWREPKTLGQETVHAQHANMIGILVASNHLLVVTKPSSF
jgi:hypothetical protein